MSTQRRGRLVLLGSTMAGVLCAGLVSQAGPAGAAEQIDPRRLVRGVESTVPHLQDGVIRVGPRSLKVSVPVRASGQTLLGRSGKDWVVHTTYRSASHVHAVRRGRAARLVPGGKPKENPSLIRSVRLSRGGQLLVWTAESRGGTETTVVRLADGKVFGIAPFNYEDHFPTSQPLDAKGNRILVAVGAPYVWNPTTARARQLPVGASSGAMMEDDVIFVATGRWSYGPTKISSPGVPAWTARNFEPHDVSPDGRLVLGHQITRSHGRQVLQLRRMSDGTVLRKWAYGARGGRETTAAFENDTRVVFEVNRGGASALVRCRVKGGCTRASSLGGTLTFPHER
ncbi:hypothetical protein [Nocardioides yefusunii]|uniref:WD40 repeat domain-containing protein n=1 Tax=Nocardioides yefusunii TaxID=2500546 RepID=A0ABW1QZB1_9ACTN|nr:hypothetical protein [Nocardioides yefusunii]